METAGPEDMRAGTTQTGSAGRLIVLAALLLMSLLLVPVRPASAQTGSPRYEGPPAGAPAPATGTTREAPLEPEAQQGALAALRAALDVEKDILRSQQELYQKAAAERDAAERRVADLEGELDAMAAGATQSGSEAVIAKDRELADADQRRAGAMQRCREILLRMQE